ncbi:GH92 family glycosyl hydrolase [Cellulomonas sp. PhB143]|uniref:GH92 family glycosyl hydrolase n=1 Tax=Cellulomonas sp. PhB143 TaxID=2485186 RepID=UPI000F485F34|nr:GH92 family glycosyl hydrolase [Cellulomonas sp. PhB143]ROS79158.1 putative alpha-1,2-mannosidase [Cellulomonas sp. PhB143]
MAPTARALPTATSFRSSFEPVDPAPRESTPALLDGAPRQENVTGGGPDAGPEPMVTAVGPGPVTDLASKPGVGFSGLHALRYAGAHVGDGPARAMNVLYDGLDVEVGPRTRLSYVVHPELLGDLAYPSTYVAVDLAFSDGTRLSGLPATDAHGTGCSARAQGEGKILYADHWNSVRVDVGAVAAGRTVVAVLLAYDNPHGAAGTRFAGWVDDVAIVAGPATIDSPRPVDHVDTRRGTMSTGRYSRGNNVPATAMPNGFNFWTPMTDGGSQRWHYEYHRGNGAANLPVLEGFGISHEPSPWMGDRNQLVFHLATGPAAGAPSATLADRGLAFDHADETARPDLYAVTLAGGATLAATPTDHGAVLRFGYPDDVGHVLIDTVAGPGELRVDPGTGEVTGWVEGGSPLSVGSTRMFVAGVFDRAPVRAGTAAGDRNAARYATFAVPGGGAVELRVATSFLGLDQARANLDLELTGRSFEDVQGAAREAWDARLGVVEVEGATEDQLVTLYSNLYRLNLYPNSQHENTGTVDEPRWRHASPVAAPEGEASDATGVQVVDGCMYVNHGFWDTYRTAWPAYSLLYPELAAELADGFVQQYREGGWVSRWSSPGYADLMTGTSSDVAFADAYVKGALPTGVALDAYDAALKNATVVPPHDAVGRKGLDPSIFLGYTPSSTEESVSWGLEGYVNDFGIGTMAAALAEDPATPDARRAALRDEAAYLLDRATRYGALFDPAVGFFRPRRADGMFDGAPEDFDPDVWGGGFTETNGWNFAFHVPHDPQGLANLYGGRAGLEAKLDEFFSRPETGTLPGTYGDVIHEMTEARDVRMGMWGVSNQPSHHIPWLYDAVGAPAKTQAAVREVTRRLFVGSEIGQGYPGDEDNGEMSAWWLFAALGLYPLQVGADRYAVGSPLFARATVHLPAGDLVIRARDSSVENVYVQSLAVDGQAWSSTSLSHAQLTGGATLELVMGPTPSSWGTGAGDALPSLTSGDEPPAPATDVTRRGTVVVDDGGGRPDAGCLVDDTSSTAVVLASRTPTITWVGDGLRPVVVMYTLTSASGLAAPASWRLEGSDDGSAWTTLDVRSGEQFRWARQTRPFAVAGPQAFARYRLVVTEAAAGATGGGATGDGATGDGAARDGALGLAQLELLARG